jgi:hypothetical protein
MTSVSGRACYGCECGQNCTESSLMVELNFSGAKNSGSAASRLIQPFIAKNKMHRPETRIRSALIVSVILT